MYTRYQSGYIAHALSLEGVAEEALTQTIASAKVDMNPHQVDAAMFALASPLSNGVILADEVGLGKTIEASLVLAQKWAEHKRRLLLVVPATLRKQWSQELVEKFSLPSRIVEARNFKEAAVRYCRPKLESAEFEQLRDRLKTICKRTLRRQVQETGGIKFTRRYSMIEDFRPSDEEIELYRRSYRCAVRSLSRSTTPNSS
jgi:SNF2 family DNA or RNA helicase